MPILKKGYGGKKTTTANTTVEKKKKIWSGNENVIWLKNKNNAYSAGKYEERQNT